MASQLFSNEQVVEVNGNELEVTAVTYQEDPETQEKHDFSYTFRLKSELDAEREAAAKLEEERKAAEEANNQGGAQ